MSHQTHTLILALAPFSDAALAVGPRATRREARPGERVTLAATAGVCEVVASLRLADELWETGGSEVSRAAAEGGPAVGVAVAGSADLFRTASFLMRARRARFDAVVDLFPKVGSLVASWLAVGGRAAAGTSRYVDALLRAKSHAGAIDPVDRIAVLLGVDPDAVGLELGPEPEADEWIERALGATGYRGGVPVVVAHTQGAWTEDGFADVVGRLRSAFGAWPVVVDTPREGGRARKVAGALGGSVLGVGAPSGARFVATLARASLVVTDDTSVAYLSWLSRVPVVLVAAAGPLGLAERAGLVVVDAAAGAPAVFDAACALVTKHRTASLFEKR
jgi:hypothetical protein